MHRFYGYLRRIRNFPTGRCGHRPLQMLYTPRQNFWALTNLAGKIQENRSGFLGRFKEIRREIEIPPGSFSFCHFFFWRSKRKSETAVEISMSVPALMCASRRLPFQGAPLGRCTIKKWGANFLLICTECRGNSVRFGRSAWRNAQKRQIKIVKNVDTASKKECGWLPFRAKSQRVRGK